MSGLSTLGYVIITKMIPICYSARIVETNNTNSEKSFCSEIVSMCAIEYVWAPTAYEWRCGNVNIHDNSRFSFNFCCCWCCCLPHLKWFEENVLFYSRLNVIRLWYFSLYLVLFIVCPFFSLSLYRCLWIFPVFFFSSIFRLCLPSSILHSHHYNESTRVLVYVYPCTTKNIR